MDTSLLKNADIFAELDEAELEAVAETCSEQVMRAGEKIFAEGEPGNRLFIISEGEVRISRTVPGSGEEALTVLKRGACFGEMSLFDEAPRSASVKAMSDVRILALARNDFLRLLGRSPDLALSVIQELTRRLRQVDEQASSLSFQRVKERTMGLLVRLAKEASSHEGRRKTPVLTHQQIADMIGTSRETVTRAVKGLKEEGWLEQEGKHYLVPAED